MRTETFVIPHVGGDAHIVQRGKALQVLIAAVYDTARRRRLFTTDDVFLNVRSDDFTGQELRFATAQSKLVSVALQKCRKIAYCEPTDSTFWQSGDTFCHGRNKRVWKSNIVA